MAEYKEEDFSEISEPTLNMQCSSTGNIILQDIDSVNDKTDMDDNENERVREALNRQTLIQYRQYAIEKYPKEFLKQEELVTELQNQHFNIYWTSVHLQMKIHQEEQFKKKRSIFVDQYNEDHNSYENGPNIDLKKPNVMPAVLWTRKDISEFKSNILAQNKSNCIKIESLSVTTIKIPTHKDGRYLYWEFATDFYDIGFGLLFQWDLYPSENLVITTSESNDDENAEDSHLRPNNESFENLENKNVEQQNMEMKLMKQTDTDELMTTFRRECHMEVYCGSHEHPGSGYYILKFDNSYSVWRSKWLYYNIYQTK